METRTLITNQIECYATIFNNPFLLAPLLPTFFEAVGVKDRGALLAYLVLPLVLPESSRIALANSNKVSSLRTFTKGADRTYGLGQRIANQRRMTNLILQHMIDLGVLRLVDNASIISGSEVLSADICPPDMLKAARKLGCLCAPHSVPSVFLQLGIKKL
ncbi:MAG: three component ABC system middle component [Phycisphaerae bacterium]|jgi:hypothetical protein